MAAPMVGENSIGICFARRSFQAAIRRSILKHLSVGRTPARGFLLRSVAALILKCGD
jgi:hypothetical protein